MQFQISVLCDAATDDRGKLNILGAFDTIAGRQFPLVHPQCALALRIQFGKMEEGEHHVALHFVDDDGNPVVKPITFNAKVQVSEQSYFSSRNMVVNWQRLKFEKPGQYAVDISVDGVQQASVPLQVIQLPQKGKPPPG